MFDHIQTIWAPKCLDCIAEYLSPTVFLSKSWIITPRWLFSWQIDRIITPRRLFFGRLIEFLPLADRLLLLADCFLNSYPSPTVFLADWSNSYPRRPNFTPRRLVFIKLFQFYSSPTDYHQIVSILPRRSISDSSPTDCYQIDPILPLAIEFLFLADWLSSNWSYVTLCRSNSYSLLIGLHQIDPVLLLANRLLPKITGHTFNLRIIVVYQ